MNTGDLNVQGKLTLTRQPYIGTFDRNMSVGNGDVSYTGIGFTPVHITFLSNFASQLLGFSTGFGSVAKNYCIFGYGTANAMNVSASYCIYITNDNSTYIQKAIVKSFDTNGFTLTWTATGSIGQVGTVFYTAI